MKKAVVILGIILLAAAGLWKIAVAPRVESRFPDGWTWNSTSIGTSLNADPKTGQFPATTTYPTDDPLSLTDRFVSISHDNAPAGSVTINDHYVSKDPNTGRVLWQFSNQSVVNQETGSYMAGGQARDYFTFPHNVQKDSTYWLLNTGSTELPLTFQQEETIQGLTTYRFAFQGQVDQTGANSSIKVQSGQAVLCLHADYEYWVEPVTGEVIKSIAKCPDTALVDKATNKVLSYITRWSSETSSPSILNMVSQISAERTAYLLMTVYIPLALLIAGIAGLGIGAFLLRPIRAAQPVPQPA